MPTDAQTAQAVSDWLDAHPEATTTVQDGSLTEAKFSNALKLKAIKEYVTPEMFGAVGDGATDDSEAINSAISFLNKSDATTKALLFNNKKYCINSPIDLTNCKNITITSNCIPSIDNTSVMIICNNTGCFILDGTKYCSIENIAIWTNSENTIGIKYNDSNTNNDDSRCFRNAFTNLRIFNFNVGCKIDTGTGYDTFNSCSFEKCNTGIDIGSNYVSAPGKISPNYIYINKCNFSKNQICIDASRIQYLFIKNNDFVDGIGIKIHENIADAVSVKDNVFFSCTYPVYSTVPLAYSEITGNTIRIDNKDSNYNDIDPHGIFIAPSFGSCSALSINNTYTLTFAYRGYFVYVSSATDYTADCNYPFNYNPTSYPIQGTRPDNALELLSRWAVMQTVNSGVEDHTVDIKALFKPTYFVLMRGFSTATEPNGGLTRMISVSVRDRTLTYKTNTSEDSVRYILKAIY